MGELVTILDNPVTDGQPVQGVCEGRIVAYWPTKEQEAAGLRAVGSGGYIPALIVANWTQRDYPAAVPCVNLRLFVDGNNVDTAKVDCPSRFMTPDGHLGSVVFSLQPAYGCWTWIPKA